MCPAVRRPIGRRSAGPPGSGRQLVAALAAAGCDDGPPGPGAHPQPEAVCSRATAVVRLKGALAHVRAPSRSATTSPHLASQAASSGQAEPWRTGDLVTVRNASGTGQTETAGSVVTFV